MPADIRSCDDHGFFPGVGCPDCDRTGRLVLSGERRRRLSKFVSGALRHFPDDTGVELDEAGWTAFDDLAAAVDSKYGWADREALAAVVATDPKGRFERDVRTDGTERSDDGTGASGDAGGASGDAGGASGAVTDQVRAAYGHSVDVTLGAGGGPVPDTLYHGTAPRHRQSILEEGWRPIGRQQVHLSGRLASAREAGQRHADDPVVFEVDATGLQAAAHDVTKRGRDVYTVERVPPTYLTER